ncbi:MAG TPA: hypothetical protein VIV60_29320 [Polyangiaceae bacterium]
MRTLTTLACLSALTLLPSCTNDAAPTTPAATGGQAFGGSSASSSSSQGGSNSSSSTASSNRGGQQSGSTASGGSEAKGGASSATAAGGSSAARGGSSAIGGTTTDTSASTSPNNGGSTAGGASASGGKSVGGGASTTTGGTSNSSSVGNGGAAGNSTAATSGAGGKAVDYMLPPPDQCHDLDQLPWSNDPTTGCVEGNKDSKCGGKCQTASVCESPTAKPTADREYMCQRNLLFSPEMEQAAIDDGFEGFHYAVVGHDPDQGGIDGTAHSCCQCYQLVYAYPSPNDRQALVNPDNTSSPASAITLPPPLIVQSFNTAATPTSFDVYMPAGGMGAQNGCFMMPGSGGDASQRKYMYTSYPTEGQPGNGGVKPASLWDAECKTEKNWVTDATLSSAACVKKTTEACNKIASDIPGLTQLGQTGCLKANTIDSFYHLNWSVYAMRVECPEHLTRVTGCKLLPQGLKAPKKDVKTAAQAAKDPDFWSKTAHTNNLYETTTMEDCCRPTCASYSQISSFGLKTDPQYRSFYNCDAKGVPWTQPATQ